MGKPISISYTPGRTRLPEADINFVPVLRSIPIFAYSSPPSFTIGTVAAIDSPLFTTVGQPYKPATAGKGGVIRGLPPSPTSVPTNAGSFPQIYAPPPGLTSISNT